MATRAVGRRGFLALTGGLAAAAGVGAVRTAGAGAATQVIWILDPEHGMGAPDVACPLPHTSHPTCHGCKACHDHGQSKRFSNAVLANNTRAHPNCKCLASPIGVTEREYIMLFGPPQGPLHRDEFDARRDQVFLPQK